MKTKLLGKYLPVALITLPVAACGTTPLIGSQGSPDAGNYDQLLAERDARIAELSRRIAALEARLGAPSSTPPAATAEMPPATAQAPATDPAGRAAPPAAPRPTTVAEATPNPDEDILSRALELTLIQEGGLLLPPYRFEAIPEFEYTYRNVQGLQIVNVDGEPNLVEQDLRRDTIEARATLRMGLPWDTQAEVSLPYVYIDEDEANIGLSQVSRSDSGIGDLQVALSKQWLYARDWMPSVITSLAWTTGLGDADLDDLGVRSGFDSLQGTVTLVKPQDPLVFFGSLGYAHFLSETQNGREIDPGNQVTARLGTILATSPDTSLRLSLESAFSGKSEVDGQEVAGSDEVAAVAEIGVSSVLTPSMLMDVTAGFGLTDDAPDLRLGISFPFRF